MISRRAFIAGLAGTAALAGWATPAQARKRVIPMIGARSDAVPNNLAGFTEADTTIGPLRTTRIFYPGALPPSVAGPWRRACRPG